MYRTLTLAMLTPVFLASASFAQADRFHEGKLIPQFGKVATIDNRDAIPADAHFKVSFDVVDRAEAGELNRNLVSAARFLNMHTEAGVPPENISLAIVIHGSAVQDVTNAVHFSKGNEAPNANAPLIAELVKHGVEIHVCGQSAAFQSVTTQDLLPNVRMSLSAMTAHALLQQKGYTLNPF